MECAGCNTKDIDPELFCNAWGLCHDCREAKRGAGPTKEDRRRAEAIYQEKLTFEDSADLRRLSRFEHSCAIVKDIRDFARNQ
jgi:hypothetical protein